MHISHIDTCLGCFLTNHHNGNNELLIGVYVDGSTSRHALMTGLIDEIRQMSDRLPELQDGEMDAMDAAKACVKSLFCDAYGTTEAALALPFDSSLETPSDDDDLDGGDYCQAWFVLTWEPEEMKGDSLSDA